MQSPLINGMYYEFASIEANLNGTIIVGFKEISYSQNLESGDVYGASPQKLGDTVGTLKAEGSVTLYKPQDAELLASFGDGFLVKRFTIVVQYSESGLSVITDTIVGARFKGGENGHSQGTDPLTVKRDFSAFYILENGKAPIPNLRR